MPRRSSPTALRRSCQCILHGSGNGHVDYVQGANIAGFMKVADDAGIRRGLAVTDVHQPRDADNRGHEAAEYVRAVSQSLVVRFTANDAHDDGRKKREKQSGLKMR